MTALRPDVPADLSQEISQLQAELRAAEERQIATAEILRTIASTPGDAGRSLQQIAETSARLFGAPSVSLQLVENGEWGQAFRFGSSANQVRSAVPLATIRIGGPNLPGTVVAENRQIHIPDLDHLDPSMADWPGPPHARAAGTRTMCGTPLRREGNAIGVLIVYRDRLLPFTDAELALQQSFADQAVIAIENARLFNETKEALERQTATSEILRVINNSGGNLTPVFDCILQHAHDLCGAPCGSLQLYEHDRVAPVAIRGMTHAFAEFLRGGYPMREGIREGLFADRPSQHIDLAEFLRHHSDEPSLRAAVELGGIGTMVTVPLAKNGVTFGRIVAARQEVRSFSDKQIALLQGFADQAVIAIENARLFNETKESLARQTATSEILRVVSQSPTDVQPVFDAIVLAAVRLIGCDLGFVLRSDGTTYSPAAAATAEGPMADLGPANLPIDPAANFPSRAIIDKKILHLPDWSLIDLPEHERNIHTMFGVNTALYLPLLRGEECIGLIALAGKLVGIFGEAEIALAESFRDQALIAIENTRLFNETKEALERQTATSDILKVIASSPSNVQPVFDVIVERAVRLCGGRMGRVYRYDGGIIQMVAGHGLSAPGLGTVQQVFPRPAADDTTAGRAILSRRPYFVTDIETDESVPALSRQMIEALGTRSQVTVPMLRSGEPIGAITVGWADASAYGDQQVALLQTFADQAVIAIENVRLFNETREALERQTATADILKVIASSPSDVQPVFEAIAASANRLIGGFSSTVFRFIDGIAHLKAFTPTNPAADEILKATFPRPVADFPPFQMAQAGEVTQIPDTEALSDEILGISRARGFRSMLFAPLMNDGVSIGFIAVTRVQPGAFADHHVQLLRTFADQAVIAIENARLFEEVQARTRDLTESLEQQIATSEVLSVISSSGGDLVPVFDAMLGKAMHLCGADFGVLNTFDGELFHTAATYGLPAAYDEYRRSKPLEYGPGTAPARLLAGQPIVETTDLLESDAYRNGEPNRRALVELGGARCLLAVPLLKDERVVGNVMIFRQEKRRFSEKQITLLKQFAAQAVIAIENTRLLRELRASTEDLRESLQQQTATADVLKVISRSAFDLQTVLETLVRSAVELSGAKRGVIFLRDGDLFRCRAISYAAEASPEWVRFLRENPQKAGRHSAIARSIASGEIVCVPDVLADPEIEMPATSLAGIRAVLAVPLLRDGRVEGIMALSRPTPGPFNARQIGLVQTFADQAVIAIENVRLFEEVQSRTRELSASLDELRTAQDRLVQTEKLASLGQLTAGIAHEIKNPLNFVNNFAALSAELTDELKDVLTSASLTGKIREEVEELTQMLKDNLERVVQHGKRADSIVKNMLLHSREGSGEHRPADINTLLDESLNLAYHGARAEKPQFNVTLQRDFDKTAGMIELFPQEITRVLLNLISNGFYAVTKRKAEDRDPAFEPMLSAATRDLGDTVEIRIRDNGIGIPAEVKEKMFNPFFTTKPAGEGTGLGLSMSHDIIVKQHGGRIDVETEPGEFTEFRIVLPRTSRFADKD